MDLTKLSPAPWRVSESVPVGGLWFLQDANSNHISTFEVKELADTCALARNAEDVMMRRGWTAVNDSEKWFVCGECCGVVEAAGANGPYPDPFTALVAADKWYRENVEAKASA